jgi:hypothetical protein
MMTQLETEQRIQEIQDSIDVLANQLIKVTRLTAKLAGSIHELTDYVGDLEDRVLGGKP